MVDFSVVIVTREEPARLRVLEFLKKQTLGERLEVVVVTPNPTTTPAGVVQLPSPEFELSGTAWSAGIRKAGAPVVALLEDHCYPEPDWAELLLEEHQKGCVAAAGSIGNANPSPRSWAGFLMAYGRWHRAAQAGPIDDLPARNGSYQRAALLELGEELPRYLDREGGLHDRLRDQGLRFQPRAHLRHLNPSRLRPWGELRFQAGRLFAARRSRRWPWWRRLVYLVFGLLVVPLRRLPTLARLLRQQVPLHQRHQTFCWLLVALALHGLGELTGYALGAGRSAAWLTEFEFGRRLQIRSGEEPTC